MEPRFREALARVAARAKGSRFLQPFARLALAAGGLSLLAFFGRNAVAGALGSTATLVTSAATSAASLSAIEPTSAPTGSLPSPPPHDSLPTYGAAATAPARAASTTSESAHAPSADDATPRRPATPDDPVSLNSAEESDLRRLPGIGAKRASAILAVRARLGGRFHALEDLLKVKGIGRATLRRLRPLLRLDAPSADAGA